MAASAWMARARALRDSNPLAVAVLVAVNLVPLVGVLFWGWDVATILIAYWLENGVIGLINIPKIMLAARDTPVIGPVIAGFFALHYGGFWIGHGIFVFVIVGMATRGAFGFFMGVDPIGNVARDPQVPLIALLLLVSHGVSFFFNYMGRYEYLNTTPMKQMFQPYGRLVILHITIIVGAFFVIGLGQPVALVALLVILKTAVDLLFHLREHAKASQPVTVI
ncbi:MAG TPA: DUF6498-containing protein [Candidatus Limnocylindrales bacterium]